MSASVLRLVVLSPDGRRVLARPNGLAGWSLPRVAGDDPGHAAWPPELLAAAARVLGSGVVPDRQIDAGVWLVTPSDRIPMAGNAWIGAHEVARLGDDARLLVGVLAPAPPDPSSLR